LLCLTLLTAVFVFKHSGYIYSSSLWLSVILGAFIATHCRGGAQPPPRGDRRGSPLQFPSRIFSLGLAIFLPIIGCFLATFSTGPKFIDPFLPSVYFIIACAVPFILGTITLAYKGYRFKKLTTKGTRKRWHSQLTAYCIPLTIFVLSLALNKLPGIGFMFMTAALVLWTALCYREPHA